MPRKKKSNKEIENIANEELQSIQAEDEPKKKSKEVFLKQWLVTGTDKDGNRISVFLLATCGMKAREAMQKKYKDCDIWNVTQSAISEKTADWLKNHSPFYS